LNPWLYFCHVPIITRMNDMIKDTLAQSPDSMIAAQDTSSDHIIFIPAGKLDADQYMVSDLDGVTEGLFGSGNMNFLMMQSAQTNELAAARGNPDFSAQDEFQIIPVEAAASGRSL